MTNKINFKGEEEYQETEYIPPKKEVHVSQNLELKLEDELVNNIELIEKNMKYIDRQVKVTDGRIDILAEDKNKNLCIIELKVVPNDEKLVFQSVYYPTQFKGKKRMITIAPDYDYKIKESLKSLNVEMKVYSYENDELKIK